MSNLKTQWNAQEDEALDYLPWRAQVLYLRGLRRFMDYETGVVGISRRISYKMLQELLEVRPRQGSTEPACRPTRDVVRAIFKMLESVGLICRVESGGSVLQLVFKLPLADTGFFRSQDEPPMNPTPRTPQGATQRTPHFASSESTEFPTELSQSTNDEQQHDDSMSNTPQQGYEQHTSGYLDITTTKFTGVPVQPFPLPKDWLPSVSALNELKALGFSALEIMSQQSRFKNYYIESQGVSRAWNNKFVEWCLGNLKQVG